MFQRCIERGDKIPDWWNSPRAYLTNLKWKHPGLHNPLLYKFITLGWRVPSTNWGALSPTQMTAINFLHQLGVRGGSANCFVTTTIPSSHVWKWLNPALLTFFETMRARLQVIFQPVMPSSRWDNYRHVIFLETCSLTGVPSPQRNPADRGQHGDALQRSTSQYSRRFSCLEAFCWTWLWKQSQYTRKAAWEWINKYQIMTPLNCWIELGFTDRRRCAS